MSARVKVYLSEGSFGHDRIYSSSFMFLVVGNEMFDSCGNALRLQASNVSCSKNA